MIKQGTEFVAWEQSQFESFMETHEEMNSSLNEIASLLDRFLHVYMKEKGYVMQTHE